METQEKTNTQRVEEICKMIERYDATQVFWMVFDSYAAIVGTEVWDKGIVDFPGDIQELLNQYGLESYLDFDYWGSDSFFSSVPDRSNMTQEERVRMDTWLDENDALWGRFVKAFDLAVWQYTENDEDFEAYQQAI